MGPSRTAGNWVDRGAPADEKVRQIIAHYLGCPEAVDAPDGLWLREAARNVIGMVEANSSEVQVAGYVRSIARARGRSEEELRGSRLVAVALWHAAKAAEVRDRTLRIMRDAGLLEPTRAPLSDWLAERILSPAELAAHQAARARGPRLVDDAE